MSPIFVLIFIALSILFIALYKSDFGLLMFSGFIFIICGLFVVNNGIPDLAKELASYGITDFSGMVPAQLFSFESLFTLRGFLMMVGGGFLVGFGARYAGGCTSGHAIMGLSDLQWPSLVATICFMIGGFIMANFILPFILHL